MATKIALVLVAEGMSYREAASITGCGDYGDLYWTAKRYGLTELHKERSLYNRPRLARGPAETAEGPTD